MTVSYDDNGNQILWDRSTTQNVLKKFCPIVPGEYHHEKDNARRLVTLQTTKGGNRCLPCRLSPSPNFLNFQKAFPNLVKTYDPVLSIVYTNQFPHGRTLKSYLSEMHATGRGHLIPYPTILHNLWAMMDTIHHHGVVHGDIKESNILIDPTGVNGNYPVQFIDLGSLEFRKKRGERNCDLYRTTSMYLPSRLQNNVLLGLCRLTWEEKKVLDAYAMTKVSHSLLKQVEPDGNSNPTSSMKIPLSLQAKMKTSLGEGQELARRLYDTYSM
jgi:serine/threonine protein kinase